MKTLKLGLATLALVSVLSMGNFAKADVIDAPDSADKVKVVDAGNAMANYDDSSLVRVKNTTPYGNMDRKYNKYQLNSDNNNVSNQYSTINGSTQGLTLQTEMFLPDGFNVSGYQHGNFQSVALDDDNNIYFVESMGKNTNQGAIAKFNLTKLNELGLNNDVSLLRKAFTYFDPYTDEGKANNQKFNDYYKEMQKPYNKVKSLTDAINRNEAWRTDQVTYKNKAAKWYKTWKKKRHTPKVRAKMAQWMKNYQYHGDKVKKYDKKIASYNKDRDKYQKQVDDVKAKDPDMFRYVDIAQAAQLSPLIDIGHGQTLSFNPQNKHLYIAEDNTLSDLPLDQNNEVFELDTHTLQPVREYKFKMLHNQSNMQLHTLAFDADGNAYWGRKTGKGYMFFYGRMDADGVSFVPSRHVIDLRGGDANQFVSYNPRSKRIYFVSDDIFTSVPAKNILKSNFEASDIGYQVFDSKREFEGLAFDKSGYGYLLTLWPPELMKTTLPVN